MIADRHRRRQRLAAGGGLPAEHREMVVGGDPRHRPRPAQRLQPRDRQVGQAALGIARDDRARRDVGPGLMLEEPGDGEDAEIGVVDHHLLARRVVHPGRGQRRGQRLQQPVLDAVDGHAEGTGDPPSAGQHSSHHRQRRSLHRFEEQRRAVVGGGQQRRQLIAPRHRAPDAHQLARRLQLGEKAPQRLVGRRHPAIQSPPPGDRRRPPHRRPGYGARRSRHSPSTGWPCRSHRSASWRPSPISALANSGANIRKLSRSA